MIVKKCMTVLLAVFFAVLCLSVTGAAAEADESLYRSVLCDRYRIAADELTGFEVLYQHQDADEKTDWVLVNAVTDPDSGTSDYYEFGNRVLTADHSGKPFVFGTGIYDERRGRYFDLTECAAEDYPDMEAVWTEIGIGRLIGDMDGDDTLTVADATMIQRCQALFAEYPEDDRNPAADSIQDAVAFFSDFDKDSDRDITDATMIQRFLAEMPHRIAGWKPYQKPVQPLAPSSDPSIPSITGFKSTGKGIEISIGTVPGAAKYRLYVRNSSGGWERMGETTGQTFVSTIDLDVGETYVFTVRCISADLSKFTSDFERGGWTYTYDPQLDVPRISRISAAEIGARITWDPVEGADLYRVYARKDGWGERWQAIADTRDTSCVYTIAYTNAYLYTVRCLSQGGRGFASDYDRSGTAFTVKHTPELNRMQVKLNGIYFEASYAGDYGPIAIFRKEGKSWKRIGVVRNGLIDNRKFLDTDVEPGKTYTYTCRCVSDDESYYVSGYNTEGWTQSFTVDQCVPELGWFMYMGEDVALVQPRTDCKFDIPKYALIFAEPSADPGEYLGSVVIDGEEPTYVRADFFEGRMGYLLYYVLGLDENEEPITYFKEYGYGVYMLEPPGELTAEKTGDRTYRFSWTESPTRGTSPGYEFSLESADGAYVIDSEHLYYGHQSYDVDLSAYPEDAEWYAMVWTSTNNAVYSHPIVIEFRESDCNSEYD